MNPGILNPVPSTFRGRWPRRSGQSAIAGVQFTREYDPDASRYIARVEARDHQPLQKHIKKAINNLVIGLKAGGVWFSIKTFGLLAGPRTLAGAMVALRGPDPIPYNFLPAHYTQTGGLVGLAAGLRTLDSGFALNSVPRDDIHASIWLASAPNATHMGAANVSGGGLAIGTNGTNAIYRIRSAGASTVAGNAGGFYGASRRNSTTVNSRNAFTSNSPSLTSDVSMLPIRVRIFGDISTAGVVTASSCIVKSYTLGTNVDLVKIEQCLLRYNAEIQNAPKCQHPEAQNWVYRVYQNGGAVSQQQANAVSDWCAAMDAIGLRNKMYRANLQTGLDIQSVLVPVYLNETPFAVTAANIVDVNVSLVNADYSPTVGTTGNGTTKYIRTIPLTSIKTNWATHSIGLDVANAYPDSTQRGHCGAFFNETATSPRGKNWISGNTTFKNGTSGNGTINSFTESSNLKVVNRESATNFKLFENGYQVGATNTTNDTFTDRPACDFCVLARGYQNVTSGVPSSIVHGDAKSTATVRGYFIADSMTPAEQLSFANAWLAMQASIGRL